MNVLQFDCCCALPGGTCENLDGNFYTCNCDAGFEPDGGDASAGTLGCRGTNA